MKTHRKKYVIVMIVLFVIIGLLYTYGVHIQFFVKHTYEKIKSGQPPDQVMHIINKSFIRPYLCCWFIEETKPICNDVEICRFPAGKGTGNNFRLQVLYFGSGDSHIEYEVTFDSRGIATAISDIRKWD